MQIDDTHLLIFGGLDKRARLNDAWLFNSEEKDWVQLKVDGQAPQPRAHFTATKFGNRIYIFGGYGGSGEVFGDLWALELADGVCRWEDITGQVQGPAPCPRFDHSTFIYPITPNSDTYDKLLIMGGRDLSAMFNDGYVLDLQTMTWQAESAAPVLSYAVCNNVCDGVESVPYHKVFSFGGKKGMMQYLNTVEVMDCGNQVWSTPPLDTGKTPCGRYGAGWKGNCAAINWFKALQTYHCWLIILINWPFCQMMAICNGR
jgi:dynein heavy chain